MTAKAAKEKCKKELIKEQEYEALISNCEFCRYRTMRERTPNGNESHYCTKWKRFIGESDDMISDSSDCPAVISERRRYIGYRALIAFCMSCMILILIAIFMILYK